ncbi:MAG: hypothetical protein MSIBF_04985 [Candidatus Altiarchaeales archaeon IMC4]|nr:MAG: hypothetical protein MSIBF_04985 [Candidatus Altiarchaeales archaeon IMC4]
MTRIKILEYIKKLKEEDIARRYFVMNSFDGALTILGIIISMYLGGISDPRVVVIAGIGAATALGVSGFWGAYASERAERMHSLRELEQHMLSDLRGTDIEKEMKTIVLLVALVDGLSPFLVSLILVVPFIVLSAPASFYASMLMVVLILFVLGVLLAKISMESALRSGLKMVSAGVVIGILLLAIDNLKVI